MHIFLRAPYNRDYPYMMWIMNVFNTKYDNTSLSNQNKTLNTTSYSLYALCLKNYPPSNALSTPIIFIIELCMEYKQVCKYCSLY